MNVFKELDSAVYLSGKGPLAMLSNNKNGCVALAFEGSDYAKSFLLENKEVFESRGVDVENPNLKPVENSYEFMQICANHGFSGIELISEEDQKSFIFCVRLEEVSSVLPTAIALNNKGISYVKTRFREFEEPTYRTIKEWQRFDILDKETAHYVVKYPFRAQDVNVFYEIRPTSRVVDNDSFQQNKDEIPSHLTLFNVPCLGHYNAIDGSVPFFTNVKLLIDFLNDKKFMSNVVYFFGDIFKSKFNDIIIEKCDLNNNFQVVKILDLKSRLLEVINPFKGCVINPNGTRDVTGYISTSEDDGEAFFHGVSGTWEIGTGNQFKKIEVRNSWNRRDTFYWNGLNSYRLKPLDRSFSLESKATAHAKSTEGDINDLLKITFDDNPAVFDHGKLFEDIEPEQKIEKYVVIYWDSVTGDGRDMPLYFDSILEVIEWFWKLECLQDFPMRKDGAHLCNGVFAIPKALDLDIENSVHEKIKEQLSTVYKKILQNGYTPSMGDDISGLINAHFKSVHIDAMGYCKDLLWQTMEDDFEDIMEILQIPEEVTYEFLKNEYNQIDVYGADEAIKILGRETWDKLSNRAKYFISSSLSQLHLLGNSPQLDYSLISIGFVKALEYELGLIFKRFSVELDLSHVQYNEEDSGEKALIELASKESNQKSKLTLGSMGHLISKESRVKSELRRLLGEYIEGLSCGVFISDKKFYKNAVNKIANSYRNGGAHDSAISLNTALKCKEFILGTNEKEGILKKLMS
jgi:hypothetical protein